MVIRSFEEANAPLVTVDVGALYSGREELIDSREVLPKWHRHALAEARVVYEATRSCPPRDLRAPLADVALAKAYAWFQPTSQGGALTASVVEDLLSSPPYMHPSGKSYAAMAMARAGDDARAFVARHWKKMHVLEIAQTQSGSAAGAAGDEVRALGELGSREWWGLTQHGDRIVLTRERLVIPERGPLGLSRLRFYDRKAWRDDAAPLVLVPRSMAVACERPASSLLCWEATAPRKRAAWQRVITASALAIIAVSVLVLGVAFVRERRRAALDRLHLLRTLTHELRTPAMALGLDIEPLRAAYDEVPMHLQEPLLRLSSGIARLHRVMHHSAKVLELYERGGRRNGKQALASPTEIESSHEMLKDLAAEWPDAVMLECDGADGPIKTDVEWLAVALRNLVENACKHGKPPVMVRARLTRDVLVVRVEDAGEPSAYCVGLHCAEERMFGSIRIARTTDTGRPFTVVEAR